MQLYHKLIHLRNISPILQRETYQSVDTGDAYIFGYIREYKGYRLVVLLNFSAHNAHTQHGVGLLVYLFSPTLTGRRAGKCIGPYSASPRGLSSSAG